MSGKASPLLVMFLGERSHGPSSFTPGMPFSWHKAASPYSAVISGVRITLFILITAAHNLMEGAGRQQDSWAAMNETGCGFKVSLCHAWSLQTI